MGTSFKKWVSENKNTYGRPRTNSSFGPGGPSKAKKPKARPPRGLRDRLGVLQSSLPPYSGPYSVGIMDIEVPVREPRNMSDITRDGEHILRLETVLMTLYYPALAGTGTSRDPSGARRWSRPTWIPRPRVKMARGYGSVAGMSPALSIPWFAATTMLTKLPAFRNARPARHWATPVGAKGKERKRKKKKQQDQKANGEVKEEDGTKRSHGHGGENDMQEGARRSVPVEDGPEPCFPLMFFSHGLEGTRTNYSMICGEFASYGFVVCAMEHRDGSAPRTFVNYPADEEPKNNDGKDSKSKVKSGQLRNARKIDYIWPKDNPYDTSPGSEKGVDARLRRDQIEMRLAEIEEAYYVLSQIVEGNGESIARRNLRSKGYIGASSRGLEGIDWAEWRDRFDIKDVTLVGHSFGSVTTVSALRKAERFNYVSQGIMLDIWGAPVTLTPGPDENPISVPILSIGTEAFALWEKNLEIVLSLTKEAQSQSAPAWFLTIRGTVHLSQSDFAILYPHTIAFFLKMTANPKRALELNTEASLEFLCAVMPDRHVRVINKGIASVADPILDMRIIDAVPEDHRPNEEFLAQKLGGVKPWRDTVLPAVRRKVRGIESQGPVQRSDELWMHICSSKEDVARYKEIVKKRGGRTVSKMEGENPRSVQAEDFSGEGSEVTLKNPVQDGDGVLA